MSKAVDILQNIKARLQEISILNGFNTDSGQRVILGDIPLGDSDPFPCIVVTEPDVASGVKKAVKPTQGKTLVTYQCEAIGDFATEDMLIDGHAYIEDMTRALFAGDNPTQLGGLQGVLRMDFTAWDISDREQGATKAGASIFVTVQYLENYLEP